MRIVCADRKILEVVQAQLNQFPGLFITLLLRSMEKKEICIEFSEDECIGVIKVANFFARGGYFVATEKIPETLPCENLEICKNLSERRDNR